jgi:undecaprenyl diphosphate synthase
MNNDLPEHVALIPDGNRRWSERHGVPRLQGHKAGAERMHQVIDHLYSLGVKIVTVWGFSTDNWKRPAEEVESIFQLLQIWIESDTPWAHSKGIQLRHIGRFRELPRGLQEAIGRAVCRTKYNTAMTLNVAFNYSGRTEIIDAVRRIIKDRVPMDNIDENLFTHYLYTDSASDVDLVIRTADEFRISNFMLWQTAYSEYYFSPVLWPDFDKEELDQALGAYCQRHRRFGGD